MALPPRLQTPRLVTQEDKMRELEWQRVLSSADAGLPRVLLPDKHRIITESGKHTVFVILSELFTVKTK